MNGKEDTLFTAQMDFLLPQKFDIEYIDADGQKKRPVMIHRSTIGCLERTVAFMIEHFAGAFPIWLSPVQVQLAPVSSKHVEGARALAKELVEVGIRVAIDEADETIGNKVRKAVGQKIPYIVVVGDKELGGEPWMIRIRGQKDQVQMSKQEIIAKVQKEIKEKIS